MWVRLRLQLPSRLQVTLPGSARGCPTVRERFRTGAVGFGHQVFGRGNVHRLHLGARASGGIGRRAGFRFQCL